MTAVDKYLQRHAEAEVAELHNWPLQPSCKRVLVIPAYDEAPDFIECLARDFCQRLPLLLICVVNRPDDRPACARNRALLQRLAELAPVRWQSNDGRLSLGRLGSSTLLWVNRETTPLPRKQGVGLARKIGADLACALIERGQVASRWIHTSDADARLPAAYFEATDQLAADTSAACYRFSHRDDDSLLGRATRLYETHLQRYQQGLAAAASPYAFFTVGSTLVLEQHAYAAARGFPRRAAGEDFYLLNKLAKLGRIALLPECVSLEPRLSQRVPFGTGPASARILARLQQGQAVESYHPVIFRELEAWLALATAWIRTAEGEPLALEKLALQSLHPVSREALQQLGLVRFWPHLNQRRDTAWRLHHFHSWFDAFRTLKFVHHLQAGAFPPQPLPG